MAERHDQKLRQGKTRLSFIQQVALYCCTQYTAVHINTAEDTAKPL